MIYIIKNQKTTSSTYLAAPAEWEEWCECDCGCWTIWMCCCWCWRCKISRIVWISFFKLPSKWSNREDISPNCFWSWLWIMYGVISLELLFHAHYRSSLLFIARFMNIRCWCMLEHILIGTWAALHASFTMLFFDSTWAFSLINCSQRNDIARLMMLFWYTSSIWALGTGGRSGWRIKSGLSCWECTKWMREKCISKWLRKRSGWHQSEKC